MSKLRDDRPPDAEADHDRGELRKPEDRSDQPGQQAPRGERDGAAPGEHERARPRGNDNMGFNDDR